MWVKLPLLGHSLTNIWGILLKATGVGGEGAHHVAWVHELVRAAVRIGHGLRLEGRG